IAWRARTPVSHEHHRDTTRSPPPCLSFPCTHLGHSYAHTTTHLCQCRLRRCIRYRCGAPHTDPLATRHALRT
ncbi:hypothetical protein BV20DRAFT_987925, partial [Pilatotrama ljubarskyi]